jgi:trans-aconitate methyltransferase
MMDYLYGLDSWAEAEANATEIGRRIFRYTRSGHAAQAVRFRREHIAGVIDQIASQSDDARVLAVASGHLREAELSKAVQTGALSRFVALDADARNIAKVKTSYSQLGVETMHASVRHLLSRKHPLGQFDLVYAAGLYDYLTDHVAQGLTARLFELTAPGGTLLIPNFAPSVFDRAYMESFMDWHPIYRDEYEMNQLLARIDGSGIESSDIYSDPTGAIVFLSVRKGA